MKICLVQYSPFYPKVGMLDSYNEVIESYVWGFAALGHEVKRLVNCFDPDSLNIIFGWQIPFSLGLIDSFPANTIFFNFERYNGYERTSRVITSLAYVASKYQIWDYSQANVTIVNALNPKFPAYYAKIAYASSLEKVPKGIEQDIDVLYYGKLPLYRYDALSKIADTRLDGITGLSMMTLTNVWGKLRDEFIARSKVIVNISIGGSEIFEIVRVSYLLANKKAVVCVFCNEWEKPDDDSLIGALKLVKTSDVQSACQDLVEDDAARAQYAEQGYEVFRQRDIREVIKQFFV